MIQWDSMWAHVDHSCFPVQAHVHRNISMWVHADHSYLFHCWSDVIMSISDVIFFAIELDWIVWNSRFVIEGRLDGMEFAFRCKAPQS